MAQLFKLAPNVWAGALVAGLGVFVALLIVAGLGHFSGIPLVLASFGASCVLLFGHPASPFSAPRNVIGGHVLSSFVGLACLYLPLPMWVAIAIAGALAFIVMTLTKTVHPPAGSNPVIIGLAQPGWEFLLFPTLVGAVALVLVARIYRRATTRSDPNVI